MKLATLVPLALLFAGAAHAQPGPLTPAAPQAEREPSAQAGSRPSGAAQQKLAPGLAAFTDDVLFGEVWPGPGLSQRDRSLVVISALIATNKPAQLQGHLGRALANGVTPREASGVLTHLAFYAGWPSVVSALEVFDRVYTAHNVDFSALQAPVPPLPPLASEAARARSSAQSFGTVAPKFVELTDRVVFDNLWRRSDLSVRDRSLVTIAAMGDDDLLEPYLRRGVEAGLTRDQIAESITQLAFYAGWGKATKAMTAVTRSLGVDPRRAGTDR